jgi:hypothetical protein
MSHPRPHDHGSENGESERRETSDLSAAFDSREIPCVDEQAAEREMQRQQQLDDPDVAEWIYLRNKAGQWVARRTPRHPTVADEKTSVKSKLLQAALDNLHIEDLFLR